MDIDLLPKLVELDTNSDSKSNYPECASLIGRKARNLGFHVEVHNAEAEDRKPRPNVVIELDADAKQTLLLATHYDVVGAGDGWKHQPFKLTIEGGRAYGRGAADDKGGVVSALSAMETLKKRGASKVNVNLLVTCDEEVGGEHGLGYLMEMKKEGRFLINGDAAILIDAGPRVYIGSSGRAAGRIKTTGSLSEFLPILEGVIAYSKSRERVLSKLTSASTKRRVWGRISPTMLDLSAGAVEYAKAGVKSNVIPGECRIKLRGETEAIILGKQGHAGYPHLAENAISKSMPLLEKAAKLPDDGGRCEFVFDLRTIPEESLDSAVADFEEYVSAISPSIELKIEEKTEGYLISETHPFVEMMKKATGEKNVYGELGGTDAQFFCRRGIPSICFGPISDESNIHGKDESVKIMDLEFVSSSIVKLCESWRDFKTSRYG